MDGEKENGCCMGYDCLRCLPSGDTNCVLIPGYGSYTVHVINYYCMSTITCM